jgi:Gas vesicle synthesis protein GvpL/GvpF
VTAPRYVYAIGRALDPAGLAGLVGIDGAAVYRVAHRDLVAVVSAAPPDEATLRARLERLDELAAVAEAHHAVVAAVATQTVVAPFRLATIYRDEHRVNELLCHRYEEFEALLDRLAGTVEVGVKLYVDHRSPARAAPSGSGRAYLHQLSQRHRRRDEERRHAAAAAERVDTALGAQALDRSHHRPQPAQLSALPVTTSSTPPTWYPPNASPSSPIWPSGSPRTSRPCGSRSPARGAPYSFAEPDRGDR